jgi:hypothetical protein
MIMRETMLNTRSEEILIMKTVVLPVLVVEVGHVELEGELMVVGLHVIEQFKVAFDLNYSFGEA